MKIKNTESLTTVVLICALLLTACGGGSANTNTQSSISGTAAGGSAVIGTLTIIDNTGQTKSVSIDPAGHYSVDISGMKEPFILKAVGLVGNSNVTYYSAALLSDVNGTVNVTPFTDLLISNIAGQPANVYFSTHNPTSSLITSSALADAQFSLRTKLAPVLAAMGLSSIDLLHSYFAADHTGLDAVLDLIKVDNTSNIVNLVNKLNSTIIAQDDVTTRLDDSVVAVVSSGDSTALVDAKADLQLMMGALNTFQAMFVTTAPTQTQLTNSGLFDTTNFLNAGANFASWIARLSRDTTMARFKFNNVAITLDSTTSAWVTAKISMQGGHNKKYLARMIKTGGIWKNKGDQRIANVSIKPRAVLSPIVVNGQKQLSFTNGLQFDLENNGTSFIQALITGPGLPNNGVLVSGSGMIQECLNGSTIPCVNISNVVDYGKYIVIWKDLNGTILNGSGYTEYLGNKPLVTSELLTDMFPSMTSISVDGKPLTSLTQIVAYGKIGIQMAIPPGYGAETIEINMNSYSSITQLYGLIANYSDYLGSGVPTGITRFSVTLTFEDAFQHEFSSKYSFY